jgi:hypothetical protein
MATIPQTARVTLVGCASSWGIESGYKALGTSGSGILGVIQ